MVVETTPFSTFHVPKGDEPKPYEDNINKTTFDYITDKEEFYDEVKSSASNDVMKVNRISEVLVKRKIINNRKVTPRFTYNDKESMETSILELEEDDGNMT